MTWHEQPRSRNGILHWPRGVVIVIVAAEAGAAGVIIIIIIAMAAVMLWRGQQSKAKQGRAAYAEYRLTSGVQHTPPDK